MNWYPLVLPSVLAFHVSPVMPRALEQLARTEPEAVTHRSRCGTGRPGSHGAARRCRGWGCGTRGCRTSCPRRWGWCACLGTPLSAAPAPAGCAGSRTNSSGLQPSTGKCLRGPSSAKQQSCQDWIFLPLDKKRCWLNLQLQSLTHYLFSIIKWPILKGSPTKQHFLDQKFCPYTDNLKFSDLIFFVVCSLNHRE